MEFISIESSHISGAYYDLDSSILYFRFKDGSIFEYYDVPEYEYQEFISSDSKGTYAHKNIYKNYKQNKIA